MLTQVLVASLAVFFAIVFISASEGSDFIQVPSSVNASEGSNASFICTTTNTTAEQTWLINYKPHNHVDNDGRGISFSDDGFSHTMTIPATTSNNGVLVQCVLKAGLLTTPSQPAVLRVQGLLGPVSKIDTKQINDTSINLSFVAPMTLVGIPITKFSIVVTSSDTQINYTMYTLHETAVLHIDNSCTKYWITISAWNEVGEGILSIIDVTLFLVPSEPTVVVLQKYLSVTTLETLLITTINTQCLGMVPEMFYLHIFSEMNQAVSVIGPCLLKNSTNLPCEAATLLHGNGSKTITVNLTTHLQLNQAYIGYIILQNNGGNTTVFRKLDTFDVRNATIVKYKDSYCVICEFVEGTRCQGCKIDIAEANKTTQLTTITVPRFNDASSVTQCLNNIHLPAGVYHVHVSDIESDGSYSDAAITLVFSIYSSEQSATPTAVYETLVPTNITQQLLITFGVLCGLALIIIVVLVSCLLCSRMKREQLSKYSKQDQELKFKEPEPTYDNAQEIIVVERARAKEIKIEQCVAYASVTETQ